MRKPRKRAIYKARGQKLRTSGIIFDEEFDTSHIKISPSPTRIKKNGGDGKNVKRK